MDPLKGVNSGLKPVYWVTFLAALGLSGTLWWYVHPLAGTAFLFLFGAVASMVMKAAIETEQSAERARLIHESRQKQGFSAPPTDMLSRGPSAGQSHGWTSHEEE